METHRDSIAEALARAARGIATEDDVRHLRDAVDAGRRWTDRERDALLDAVGWPRRRGDLWPVLLAGADGLDDATIAAALEDRTVVESDALHALLRHPAFGPASRAELVGMIEKRDLLLPLLTAGIPGSVVDAMVTEHPDVFSESGQAARTLAASFIGGIDEGAVTPEEMENAGGLRWAAAHADWSTIEALVGVLEERPDAWPWTDEERWPAARDRNCAGILGAAAALANDLDTVHDAFERILRHRPHHVVEALRALASHQRLHTLPRPLLAEALARAGAQGRGPEALALASRGRPDPTHSHRPGR